MKGSALLAAAAATESLGPTEVVAQQANGNSPNERLNVAVIGVKSRGRNHISGFAGRHNCVVTHVCDPDSAVVGGAISSAQGSNPNRLRPEYVRDLRRIMDNNDIHIVSIATPNHWHSLAAIWAMQSGKHVYVEKPVSHNVWEGRRLVEISRATGKLCQAGTQIRSSTGVQQAIQYLQSGQLGALQVARGLCYKRRGSIGLTTGPQPIPATIDYNLWCGPASAGPLRRARLHYDWHWTWEYGNGDLGNQGIHQMDVARWGLNRNQLANSVLSVGGRFGYEDDGETANTQIAVFDYGNAELIFEVRGLNTDDYRGARIGNVFHCANGYMVCPNYNSAVAYDRDGRQIRRWNGGGDHYGNLVNAIRANRRQDLNGEIEEGHLSSALCHLANISYRLGTPTSFNGQASQFANDENMAETFNRMRQHLQANQVPLGSTQFHLGPRLTMNPETERFTNNNDANAMLTREYRAPFVVPANNS